MGRPPPLLEQSLYLTLLCSIRGQELRLGLVSPYPSNVYTRNPERHEGSVPLLVRWAEKVAYKKAP